MNLIAYAIYAIITYLITVRVGYIFWKNGYHFIKAELQDEALTSSVNNMLLGCYYLVNLGYITLMIWFWEAIPSVPALVESLSEKTGLILLMLGGLHCMNMGLIYFFSRKNAAQVNVPDTTKNQKV